MSGKEERKVRVVEVLQRTRSVKSVRVENLNTPDFKAGQWLFVKLKVGSQEIQKPLTISSSPTEKDYLEFTKRLTGSDFSKALDQLKPGDSLDIKYPFGNFTYEDEYPKIAFLAGGIGITPIRSICKNIADKKLSVDVVLFYGNNTEGDVPFLDEFQALGSEMSLKVVPVVAQPEDGWKGYRGFITDEIIREEAPDYLERRFYLCGPPLMVEKLKEVLHHKLRLPDKHIVSEKFSGY